MPALRTMTVQRSAFVRLARWSLVPVALIASAAAWFILDPGFKSIGEASRAARMPQQEFEQRVRAYLLDNPEVIFEAAQRLQARQREAAATEGQAALKARIDEVLRDPDSPVGGNPAGDVTLVEFFDYNCPYCRRVAPAMAQAVAADPLLRIVYKELPILGANSMFAAKAALAAHRQGAYLAFHHGLMSVKGIVDEAAVLDAASVAGLDIGRLRADMEDAAIRQALDRNIELAQALRITGTPGFVAGDQIVRGAIDLKTMQALIQKARTGS